MIINISQTRQVLMYLWATHPSAPKLADDDKMRTVSSYFRVLWQYDIQDVLDAVDAACRASPSFVPSAYEIETRCHKTYGDERRYLPAEYGDTVRALEAAKQACVDFEPTLREAKDALEAIRRDRRDRFGHLPLMKRLQIEGSEEMRREVEPYSAVEEQSVQMHQRVTDLEERIRRMETEAAIAAREAYERSQLSLAAQDLRNLGYERFALGG